MNLHAGEPDARTTDRSANARILVVGGGIGGLAMGAALAKCGHEFEVFEQVPEIREVGAGVGLWSNALASLDALGAGDSIRASCVPLRVAAGSNHRGRQLSNIDMTTLGADFAAAACYVVLRSTLVAALAQHVPVERLHTGRRCESVTQHADGVTLRFDDGSTEDGALGIGADGIRSVVRGEIVPSNRDPIRYSGQTCFRGIARIRPPDPGVLREVQGPGQRCAVCPVDDGTVYWWAALNAPENVSIPQHERADYLLRRYAGWPHGITDAVAATATEDILQNDLVDRAPVRSYAKGRVVLIGDAAHPTTPNLGQGANMAIDDAIVLARALRVEPDIAAALARYQRERLTRTRLIVERSWGFGQLMRWHNPVLVSMREWMLRATPRSTLVNVLRWQVLESVGTL